MGNLMSSEATPSEVKKYGVSDATINEDKMLVDKILRKAKEMYDQNYKSFLNEDFCNNVFVAYSKKLYELPIKKNPFKRNTPLPLWTQLMAMVHLQLVLVISLVD